MPRPSKKNTVRTEGKVSILDAVAELNKKHGDGDEIVSLASRRPQRMTESIPTGSLRIDAAIGCGGFPQGRIIEIFGPEHGGKSIMTTHMLVQAQKKFPDKYCVLADAEQGYDLTLFDMFGGDRDRLIFTQEDQMEDLEDMVEMLVQSGEVSMFAIDSAYAMQPRAASQGEFGEALIGIKARLLGQFCNKTKSLIRKNDTAFIFTNQMRYSMQGASRPGMPPPMVVPGGKAIPHAASLRIEIKKIYLEEAKAKAYEASMGPGFKMGLNIKKTRWNTPSKVESYFVIGQGFDYKTDLIDVAIDYGILRSAGSYKTWVAPDGEEINFQNLKQFNEKIGNFSDKFELFEAQVKDAVYAKLPEPKEEGEDAYEEDIPDELYPDVVE